MFHKTSSNEDLKFSPESKLVDESGGGGILSSSLSAPASSYTNAVSSCIFYSISSVAMVLLNKAIPMSVPGALRTQIPQLSIILFQCSVAVVLSEFARFMKWIDYSDFSLNVARQWLPVNILFIGMLISGFLSIVYVSVPMVTIFKNLTNLVTIFGDYYLFGERFIYIYNDNNYKKFQYII